MLDAAQSDPASFIRGLDRAIIDEIQRVPDLLLAIKKTVGEDYRPGRSLLTGSANVLALPRIADTAGGCCNLVVGHSRTRPELTVSRRRSRQTGAVGAIRRSRAMPFFFEAPNGAGREQAVLREPPVKRVSTGDTLGPRMASSSEAAIFCE